MKRKVNAELLSKWLEINGNGVVRLMSEAGVSYSTIQRLKSSKYDSEPSRGTIVNICRVTGLSEEELFPLVNDEAS